MVYSVYRKFAAFSWDSNPFMKSLNLKIKIKKQIVLSSGTVVNKPVRTTIQDK